MRPFHSFLTAESVSNSGKKVYFSTLHEIWMLFVSPANPPPPTPLAKRRPTANGATGGKTRIKIEE